MSEADMNGHGMDYLRPFLPGLESVLEDEDVSEIMINGPGNVWVERLGEIREHPAPGLDGAALDRAAIQIARPLGLDPASSPILDARLDDGSRVAICVPPAAPHVAITIRRFGKRSFSPEDLVRFGSLPQEVLDEARAALLERRNILVSGGTGSGKTTLLNALVELLPADDRIVSIEDTLELRIDRKNCVRFEARGIDSKSVTIRDLVRHALRHRPDHIVVGEVRGGEAADLLQALNTGHSGSPDDDPRQQCRIGPVPAGNLRHARRDGLAVGSHLPGRRGRDLHGDSHDAARGEAVRRRSPPTWAITTPQSGAGTTGPLCSPTPNSNWRRCGDARQRCQHDETGASLDCQGDASTGSRIQRGKESLLNGPDLAGKT